MGKTFGWFALLAVTVWLALALLLPGWAGELLRPGPWPRGWGEDLRFFTANRAGSFAALGKEEGGWLSKYRHLKEREERPLPGRRAGRWKKCLPAPGIGPGGGRGLPDDPAALGRSSPGGPGRRQRRRHQKRGDKPSPRGRRRPFRLGPPRRRQTLCGT